MDTLELKSCIEEYNFLNEKCIGVFSADHVPPKIPNLPCCFIGNTDPSNKPGQHWVAFVIDENKNAEYFDSYGMKPANYNFEKYIRKQFKKIIYNKQRIQGAFSTTCGQFSLFYIFIRSMGISMNEFLRIFDEKDFHSNDHLINDICDYYFDIAKPLYSVKIFNKFCTVLGH